MQILNNAYFIMLIEFILSLKWLWIIVIILSYRIIISLINAMLDKIQIQTDTMVRDTKYTEEDINAHLSYIITEALDEYVLLNITPKNIYYINTNLEKEITNYLSDEVPQRLSKVLLTHLAFIYNDEYIGTHIGKYIYMSVTNYVIDYNMNHEDQQKSTKNN